MIRTLRLRFLFITMSIVSIMLLVIFSLVLHLTHQRLLEDNLRMMEAVSRSPMAGQRPNDSRRGGEELRLPFFVLTLDKDGNILSSSGDYYDLTDEASLSILVSQALSTPQKSGTLSEYSLRYLKQSLPLSADSPVPPGSDPSASTVLVFSDISSELSTMNTLLRNCILIAILAFFVFFALSVLFARWAVRPVEEAWSRQRQFVSDASHELKTPLTVILTNAELLKLSCERESAAPEARRFSENILTMAQQMRGLTESLLELARLDDGSQQALSFSELDFSRLCESSLLSFEAVFFERGLQLESRLEPSVLLRGSESQLRQLFEILLDNAQKYSAPHGTVRVALSRQGSRHALLSVSNPGEALSEEELKELFKRFYRRDRARTMNHSYGLGLSIAESIVEKHQGRIWAESENGSICFYAELPLIMA